MPTMREQLAALAVGQRSARKAALHLADVSPRIGRGGYTWTDNDLEITVTSAAASGKALTLTLTAKRDGKALPLTREVKSLALVVVEGEEPLWDEYIVYVPCNPFIFVNPPVGLWTRTGVNETVADAFKTMVADAVRAVI